MSRNSSSKNIVYVHAIKQLSAPDYNNKWRPWGFEVLNREFRIKLASATAKPDLSLQNNLTQLVAAAAILFFHCALNVEIHAVCR